MSLIYCIPEFGQAMFSGWIWASLAIAWLAFTVCCRAKSCLQPVGRKRFRFFPQLLVPCLFLHFVEDVRTVFVNVLSDPTLADPVPPPPLPRQVYFPA